mgnify:CR=1 FL=1
MALTEGEARRTAAERQRIIGDLDGLTPGQVLDRYIEAAEWTAAQLSSNRVDYLGGVATGLAHALSLVAASRGERTILVAIIADAVQAINARAGGQ